MARDGWEWLRVARNGWEWLRVARDGWEWLRVARDSWEGMSIDTDDFEIARHLCGWCPRLSESLDVNRAPGLLDGALNVTSRGEELVKNGQKVW